MNQIICPNCKKAFTIDESDYEKLISQIRTSEFDKEIQEKLKNESKNQEMQFEIEKIKNEKKHNEELIEKDKIINNLENELKLVDSKMKAAVNEAVKSKDKELSEMSNKLTQLKSEFNNKSLENQMEYKAQLSEKNNTINKLSTELKLKNSEIKTAVNNAVKDKDMQLFEKSNEISQLQSEIEKKDYENQIHENELKESYEKQLKLKDEQIEQYKDFKIRQSTKMIGESLEQHCWSKFNELRPLAFKKADFKKDNDIKDGTKGDFIFKDYSDDGTEYISIMFEMKNEDESTGKKQKNEQFFQKLDKDRKQKKCEYAVLVSTLEKDNDLYNNGIVDVSYTSGYEKMYVIRPQFFIPLITILCNTSANSIKYKQEIYELKNQERDFSNFEKNINDFKEGFSRNYELASRKFSEAIDEIDKTISHLNKIKENLVSSERNLRLANDKANNLSIKKLTANAPSIKKILENI